MRVRKLLSALILISVAGHAPAGSATISPAAAAYLKQALDAVQSLALHRQEIDWHRLRREAEAYASDAQTPQDTYAAIEYACTQLKDHGSRLYQPRSTPSVIQSQSRTLEAGILRAAHGRKLTSVPSSPFATRRSFVLAMLKSGEQHYAYLVIPSSWSDHAEDYDPRRAHQWAEELSSLVTKGIQQGAEGWILDLRGTAGIHAIPC